MEDNEGAAQEELFANRTCENCKSRKKKCDKKLPHCSRCARVRLSCHYGDDSEIASPGTNQKLDSIIAKLNKIEASICQSPANPEKPIASPSSGLPTAIKSPDKSSSLGTGPFAWMVNPKIMNISYVNVVFTANVAVVINETGCSATQIMTSYLMTIHKWLPIIHPETLQQHLKIYTTLEAKGDLSLLVLSMFVLTSPTSTAGPLDQQSSVSGEGRETDSVQTSPYLTCKNQFAIFQAIGEISIQVVQSGLLIALYEYGQAMLEKAYITLGTCMRMATLKGFHKHITSDTSSGSLSVSQEEELRLWWAINILDKNLSLELTGNATSLMIMSTDQGSRNKDRMPSTVDPGWNFTLDPSLSTMESCAYSNSSVDPSDTFVREIKASQMLARVYDIKLRLQRSHESPDIDEVVAIDHRIQSILNEPRNPCQNMDLSVGGTGTCISSLLTLHSIYIDHVCLSDSEGTFSIQRLHETVTLMGGLMKSLHQTLDMNRSDISNIYYISLCYVLFCTGLSVIKLHCNQSLDTVQLLENPDMVEVMWLLRNLSQRWKLAQKYTNLLLLNVYSPNHIITT